MKRTARTRFLLGAMAGTLGLALLAPAPARCDGPVTTSLLIPFQGTTFANDEAIAVTGLVHMVVRAYPVDPTYPVDPNRIYTNLAAFRGVGLTSGMVYRATGAASFAFDQAPPANYAFSATYRLYPVDPSRFGPLPLSYLVGVNANGTVGGVSVTVGGGGGDVE